MGDNLGRYLGLICVLIKGLTPSLGAGRKGDDWTTEFV